MKAVIMAGGEGRRLRPLTDRLPKPLLPVAGVPAVNRILKLLARHGITEAAVTTGYLAPMIEEALGPRAEGVALTYFRESVPLGTAGGVAAARAFIGEDDFVVISGDAVSETDLTAAFRARRESGAVALLVLTRAADPGEYGVVLCDPDGAVTGFSEKPSLSGTFSDTVNTGIYVFSPAIFSYIPEGACDFGRDLFPALLRDGVGLRGLVDPNDWCDIGDPETYRRVNLRLSDGPNAVGPGCQLPESGVSGSVLMRDCRIGDGSRIKDAVLCAGVTVGKNALIGAGSVIGYECRVGDGAILTDGTVLPSGTVVPDGAVIRSRGLPGGATAGEDLLSGTGLRCPADRMTVSFAVRIGAALCEAAGKGRIGLMRDEGDASGRIGAALLRGIRSHGGEAVLLGTGFAAAASYGAAALGLSLCLFVSCADGAVSIALYDGFGLYPVRDRERAFLRYLRQLPPAGDEKPRPVASCPVAEQYYLPMLVYRRCTLDGFPVSVSSDNYPSRLLTRALLNMGGRIVPRGGLRLSVSDDGFLLLAEQDGFQADDWHIKALLLRYLIRGRVALPASSPEAVLDLCRERCLTYTHCPADKTESEARAASVLYPELTHGAAAAMELAGLLAVSGRTLRDFCRRLPRFVFRSADFRSDAVGRLGILPTLGTPAGDGVLAAYAHGSVRIIPSRAGFRLTAEAASGEYAEELLSLSEAEIRRLLSHS